MQVKELQGARSFCFARTCFCLVFLPSIDQVSTPFSRSSSVVILRSSITTPLPLPVASLIWISASFSPCRM